MLTDAEFLRQFENGTLAEFHHQDHIRMAWLYLRQSGYEIGSRKISEGLRGFAAAKGAHRLYHETITRFWALLVLHVIDGYPDIREFREVLQIAPFLGKADSIFKHYSREHLMSEDARNRWLEPDIIAMPTL